MIADSWQENERLRTASMNLRFAVRNPTHYLRCSDGRGGGRRHYGPRMSGFIYLCTCICAII